MTPHEKLSAQREQPELASSASAPEEPFPARGLWWRLRIDGLLLVVTMIWGSTFLVTKYTIHFVGLFTYLGYNFGIGALTLALLFRRHLRHLTGAELRSGLILGLLLFSGYALQTLGLQYTITSKAGFITGLYIPLVPLFAVLLLRQRPSLEAGLGFLFSLLGLTLLSVNKDFNLSFGLGEALILGCAIAFALHIVCISKFVVGADALNLAIVQLATTSALSLTTALLTHEGLLLPASAPIWGAVLFMGVVDIGFCMGTMNWAQQYISSTHAALIYACEPVWAGIFGTLAGQTLSGLAWVGGACICLGMIMSEIRLATLLKGRRRSG
ncbi:DMT family transporter [Thermogemmatispora carboxidivorans]|uniref:DMT family transporter n=1 Tax=Thermogemmatispora carboxidivorans TaxID=1382306 RepID=UPI00069AFD73|nr:DMT family transporter [Thermogemmatispora carboxidivorans]